MAAMALLLRAGGAGEHRGVMWLRGSPSLVSPSRPRAVRGHIRTATPPQADPSQRPPLGCPAALPPGILPSSVLQRAGCLDQTPGIVFGGAGGAGGGPLERGGGGGARAREIPGRRLLRGRGGRGEELGRGLHSGDVLRADLDDFHTFDVHMVHMDHRSKAAKKIGVEEHKTWPIYEKIKASGPGNANTAYKVKHCLTQIERILDVFEPGQIALSYNGGKDSTCLMELVKEACAKHPTHKFTHVQCVWFRTPGTDFEELVGYVKEVAVAEMTDKSGLKTITDDHLSRLWSIYVSNGDDYARALGNLATTTDIRCIMMGSRRSDPGCRDLSEVSLLEQAPRIPSSGMTRLKLETQLNMMKIEGGGDAGVSKREPSLIRFSPLLEWSYRDVWDFILASRSTYCPLYDQGYSSIGTVADTVRNYALLKSNVERKHRLRSANPPPMLAHSSATLTDLEARKLDYYKSVGVGLYDSSSVGGDYNSFRIDATAVQGEYYPAWYLTDESKESASRIAEKATSSDNMFISSHDPALIESAAVLMIGDGILSGAESNTHLQFLCNEIRRFGLEAKQVMTVENDIDVIAFMIRRMSAIHKYVYIIGGVGTGHGDHAIAAVAKACGVATQKEQQLLSLVLATVPPCDLTEFHLRMADIPFGADVLGSIPDKANCNTWDDVLHDWPVVVKNNCILLSKASLLARFHTLEPLHKASSSFVSRVTVLGDQGTLAPKIALIDTLFTAISAHMFPSDLEEDETVVWIQGKNFDQQQAVVDQFLDLMEEDDIVDVYEEHLEEPENTRKAVKDKEMGQDVVV